MAKFFLSILVLFSSGPDLFATHTTDCKIAEIDRFVDDEFAVLLVGEDESELVLSLGELVADASPSDWLHVCFKNGVIVEMWGDVELTESAKRRIALMMESLGKRQTTQE